LSSKQPPRSISYNGKVLDEPFDSTAFKTTLDYLKHQGVDVQYQCLEGYCGACRCKLIEGEVDYPIYPMAVIRDGEVLTCCSVPLSDLKMADPF
jgi:ferredoxin